MIRTNTQKIPQAAPKTGTSLCSKIGLQVMSHTASISKVLFPHPLHQESFHQHMSKSGMPEGSIRVLSLAARLTVYRRFEVRLF
jgi:hypothetical protein